MTLVLTVPTTPMMDLSSEFEVHQELSDNHLISYVLAEGAWVGDLPPCSDTCQTMALASPGTVMVEGPGELVGPETMEEEEGGEGQRTTVVMVG